LRIFSLIFLAGYKSPTRQSQRYGDGAWSPHPAFLSCNILAFGDNQKKSLAIGGEQKSKSQRVCKA
jgi:hypothetical protein